MMAERTGMMPQTENDQRATILLVEDNRAEALLIRHMVQDALPQFQLAHEICAENALARTYSSRRAIDARSNAWYL